MPDTPKARYSAFTRKSSGPKVLGITGLVLGGLTIIGAALRHSFPTALWTQILFSVSIAGLVGFFTNWVAIKMLFHPRVKFMGVQGVVPSRRIELARSVAATMEEHLISADRMHRVLVESGAVDRTLETLALRLPLMLEDPHARAAAHNEVRRGIQTGLDSISEEARTTLKKKLRGNMTALISGATAGVALGPLAGIIAAGASKSGMLDPIVDKLMTDMIEELDHNGGLDKAADQIVAGLPRAATDVLADNGVREKLTEMVFAASEDLIKAIDVKKLVEQELLAHDDAELEALIDAVASNELVFIQVAGGGLGMLAGLALVWPLLLAPFSLAFAAIWLLGRNAESRARSASTRPAQAGIAPETEREASASVAAEREPTAGPPPTAPPRLTQAMTAEPADEAIDAEFVAITKDDTRKTA